MLKKLFANKSAMKFMDRKECKFYDQLLDHYNSNTNATKSKIIQNVDLIILNISYYRHYLVKLDDNCIRYNTIGFDFFCENYKEI